MAFIAGKDSAITIDGTALTSYVDSMSLSRDVNTLLSLPLEITTKPTSLQLLVSIWT